MLKKLTMLLALLMLLTEIPSCSFTGLSAQNLMSPPKANADQQSIYRLLQGAQTELRLVYPSTGEYRSAITMHDFTGDGIDDAIGFQAVEDGGVEVQFLVKSDGDWQTASAFRNPATQVDRVYFGSSPGGGQVVFIGWGSTGATSTGRIAVANAYIYDGRSQVEEYQLGNYAEMVLTDFDGDGAEELFTIDKYVGPEQEEEEAVPARARVYAFDQDKPYERASTEADNSMAAYTWVSFCQLNATTCGVVVDGTPAASSIKTTQIFTLKGTRLRNYPDGVNNEEVTNLFSRLPSIPSQDINGDGYMEFPVVSKLPCIAETVQVDSTSYLVEWRAVTAEMESRVVLRALMNQQENYWFRLPYLLQGKLCAANDTERRTVTYTEVTEDEDGNQLLAGTLFSVRVFSRSEWESRGESSGYSMIAQGNDLVYGIRIATRNERYRRAVEEIARNFQLGADAG